MLRYIAPAGAPIRATDLIRWVATTISTGDVSASLIHALKERLSVRHAYLTSTGRAGLTVLLRAMRRMAPATRTEVVLPAYTCYSVAASVIKAGLTPRIVDIVPETLDYDRWELESADFAHVLAIVATNLYGLPNDLPSLSRLARCRGVFLIDDAAQAMGASVDGRLSGTWGDAGLFSFDKGKNVSAIDGGVVVTRSDEVALALDQEICELAPQSAAAAGTLALKALAYFALLRPSLYWMPQRLPQLGLGQTVFTTDFPVARPTRVQAALALTMLARLDEFTKARVDNATTLLRGIHTIGGLTPIAPAEGAAPVYLRLPLMAPNEGTRRMLMSRLNAAGIGATGSYPQSIAEIAEIQKASGTRRIVAAIDVARRIVTLPTHPFVSDADIRRTVGVLTDGAARGTLGEARAT